MVHNTGSGPRLPDSVFSPGADSFASVVIKNLLDSSLQRIGNLPAILESAQARPPGREPHAKKAGRAGCRDSSFRPGAADFTPEAG